MFLLSQGQLARAEKSSIVQNSESVLENIPSKQSITFRNLTKNKDGLIDNLINDVVQDNYGHIWVASYDGLSRYNGHSFTDFFDGYLLDVEIDDTKIDELVVDNEHTLWIRTSSALHSYDYQKNIFETVLKKGDVVNGKTISNLFSVGVTSNKNLWVVTDIGVLKRQNKSTEFLLYTKKNKKLPVENPRLIFVTKNENLLISSLTGGLWKYNKSTDSFVQFIQNIDVLEKDNKVFRALKEMTTGRIWTITNNSIIQIGPTGKITKRINKRNTSWLQQARLEDIEVDRKNNLVISTKGAGIYYLNSKGELIQQIVTKFGETQSLLSNKTTSVFLDKDGLIWIGTEGAGISLWNNTNNFIQRIEYKKNQKKGLSDGQVWGIFQDRKNQLWIGTDKGLNFWDSKQRQFIYFNIGEMSSGESAEVTSISESFDGKLWLATGLGLMKFDPKTKTILNFKTEYRSDLGIETDSIWNLFTDSHGRLWIGHDKGLSYLDKGSNKFVHLNEMTSKLNSNEVGAIIEGSNGEIWLGTSKGICRYVYSLKEINCKIKNYGGITPKDTFLVSALQLDGKNLWVGYSGNGLLKLDVSGKSETYTEYKYGKGFPSNNVSSILMDSEGRLWMSTQNGLVVFYPNDNTYTVIRAKDGLEESEFNEGSFTKLSDGRFAFGTVKGVVIVKPDNFQVNKKISKVFISSIFPLSGQKPIVDIEKVSLPEEKSGLRINFSNLNYFSPEHSRYQYKSGKFKDWIDLGNKSEILFAESKSGKHHIYIRSKYLSGHWGPEKVISFDVYPPLWRNNFFLALYAILAIGSIVFFMRYRQQQLIEKYKMLDVIKENEQQLRLSLDASEQGVWDWKTKNDYMTRSKTMELLHFDAPSTLVEFWALIEENDRLGVIQAWNSHLFGKQQNYHCQYRIKLEEEEIWIEEQGRAISRDKFGMANHISGTYRNITHLKVIEKNLNLLAKAFEDTAEGMLVVDSDLNVVQVNKAVTEITGYPSDSLIGSSISARAKLNSPISFFDEVWQGVAEKGTWQGEVWQKNIEEDDIPLWLNVSEIKDKHENDTYYVLIMSDMSERKATEEELRYLANYDTLTKLPNRALLRDRLDHALGNARRQHRPLALLFLDLDRFKNVNDSFGHAVGDGLLKVVSERLQECLREDDTVSRLGGDEFVILMEHFSSINAIAGVTEKIRIAMTHPFRLEGIDIQASFSIGVSVYPSDGEDSATLLRNADTAMYHAKSAGRNRVQFYAPKMNETALERLTLENDLRSAIGSGQLDVYYQPQVRSHDGSIYGAEALVRWNHPTRGLVMPNDFIPMAEESDLIVSMGNEVLYKACVQMQKWKVQFGLEIKISINLAARQLQQIDLARHIENVVNRAGLDPTLVCLEITETAVMEDLKRARKILDALRAKGFKIAIDDFGTGYSSLNYLRNIPLDIIKIDYSFVKELLNNSVDQAIVSAIIEIGAALDLQVLAEGIETIEQKQMLLNKGCEIFQGYYFGRPTPAKEFTQYIENSVAIVEANKRKHKV